MIGRVGRPSARHPVTLATGRQGRTVAALVANGFAQAATAVVASILVKRAFQQLQSGESARPFVDLTPAALAVLGFVGTAVAGALLRRRERIDAERLGQSFIHRVRLVLYDHLVDVPPRTVGGRSQGAIALRFVGDLSAIRRWVSLGLARLVVGVSTASASLAALWMLHPLFSLGVGASVSFGVAGSALGTARLRSATSEARRLRSRLAGTITERVGRIGVIQANGAVDRERRRLSRDSRRVRDAMVERAQQLGWHDAVVEFTVAASTGSVLCIGMLAAIPLVKVAAAMTVAGFLGGQLRGLGHAYLYRQESRIAWAAIHRFLELPRFPSSGGPDAPQAVDAGRHLETHEATAVTGESLRGSLDLVDVEVGPLSGLTVSTSPGQFIVVVGAVGTGKSTLLAAVAGLIPVAAGSVRLDGEALTSPSQAAGRVALVAADLPLLRGSLRRNLTYRNPRADDATIAGVVEACGLDGLVAGLPDGMETRIDEGGRNLSAGQRHLVMLARALLDDPALLLLDEIDGLLDPHGWHVIERLVERRERTVVLVTHDVDWAAAADRVWLVRDGSIVNLDPAEAPARDGRVPLTRS